MRKYALDINCYIDAAREPAALDALEAFYRKLARDGEKLRSRLGAHLQAKFGFTSEALVKFGFKPRRIPHRIKVVVEKPVPQPPTAAADQTASSADDTAEAK